jgi:uncharacterized protein (TIGR02145 family)
LEQNFIIVRGYFMNVAKLFFCLAVMLLISCATEIISEEICINGVCAPNNSSSNTVLTECPAYNQSTHFCDSRDYKIYKYAVIGSQTWMAENLNYAASSGSVCYNNQDRYCDVYGRLYNWATAMAVCPDGWHLPSVAEWDVLLSFVDSNDLKAREGWHDNYNGIDSYGFAALPGGIGYSDGSFSSVGYYGHWWSASRINAEYAYLQSIIYYSKDTYWGNRNKANLYSVRCLQ